MKQKKLIALLLCALMTVAALTGCGGKKEPEKEPDNLTLSDTVNIACMNGPTGMAMAPLMDTENYNIKVYQSPADALPEIIKGDIDIACVPSNMAAVLYNKTGGNIICQNSGRIYPEIAIAILRSRKSGMFHSTPPSGKTFFSFRISSLSGQTKNISKSMNLN